MIQINEEQHLGWKALIFFFLRRMLPVIIFVILIIIALPIRDGIVNNLNSSISNQLNYTDNINLVYSIFSIALLALLVLSIVFFILGLIICILEYKTYSFTFEEFDLRMKRGILNRKENSIPYRQIQDVDTEQPLLYLILGLSKVTITTAGHEEPNEHGKSEIILEPLDVDIAEEIRVKLEREIGVQVVESEDKADVEAKNDI